MKIKYILYLLIVFRSSLAESYIEDEFIEFENEEDVYSEVNEETEESKVGKTDSLNRQYAEFSNKEGESKDDITDFDEEDVHIDVEVNPEFENFQDQDEFDAFEEKEEKPLAEPKITIANVVNLSQRWDSYHLEMLMILGLLVYFLNYALGRSKNAKIANSWFQTHKQMLEENFAMVGDDGNKERNENVSLIKETESVFTLWCSGRTCCEGMLVELRLIKRHDLVSFIANLLKPSYDQVHVTVRMNKEDMDSFVFAVANKRTALQMSKDLQDISVYCPERKAGEKFSLPANFQVMSEIAEATSAMLDSKITTIINTFPEHVDYIHFSDQFAGLKPTEEATAALTKLPDVDKVLRFGFNLQSKRGVPLEQTLARLKPLMTMVFYTIDKMKRYRMSKEAKNKADKNRQKVEEAFLKSTHQARAEAAAARREEKRRQEKEKLLAENDPEKQRRWEIKEEKRQAKKRAPRMKQLKVKAL